MEISVRLVGAIQLIITIIKWPYYLYLSYKKRPSLPPMNSPFLRMSGIELARKIRNREIKSRTLIEAFIQRIREVNPFLNAIVEERFKDALKDADEVDNFLSSTTLDTETIQKQTPFLGVPFTVKESCGLKGLSFSIGSVLRKGIKAPDDGEAIKKLKKSGAIPLAVTCTPELCMSWETNNNLTGITKNPYDIYRTCGGSSGGEGALIGSAASIIGVGSDIAGSIRLPCMYNGIYGHKPSPGFISLNGHFPNSTDKNFNNFLSIGPMVRYVEDLKPVFEVLCGGENASRLRLNEEVDISKINVFYKEDAGFSLVAIPVDKEIKLAIRDATSFLKQSYNCHVEEAQLKDLEDSVEISGVVFMGIDGIPNLMDVSPLKEGEDTLKENRNLYFEILKSCLGYSEFSVAGLLFALLVKHNIFVPKEKYAFYCEKNENLRKEINEMLKDNGVFIYPTHPIPAMYHNDSLTRSAGIMYTMIFNTLQLPSTHVPTGLDKNGLPIGFQVIAGEKQDRLCLAVAKALDARFGGWVPPPCTTP